MIALMLAWAAIGSPEDTLAPARQGKLQCYSPDRENRTCRAIAGYVLQSDGSYLNTANVVISRKYGISMRSTTGITVKNGAVCGSVSRADSMEGTVLSHGVALQGAQADAVLTQVADVSQQSGMIDSEICTTYLPDGDHLRAEVTVAGKARPEYTDEVIWIAPDEGYTLAS